MRPPIFCVSEYLKKRINRKKIYPPSFDAIENDGSVANELVAVNLSQPTDYNYALYLDWQGAAPTSLYVGAVPGQYSSEYYDGAPEIRSLNSEGGSAGITFTPEPSTLALAGLGGLLTFVAARRRQVCH